ncbi:MAG: hypothetical protein FJ225_00725 [Lentisphaerae bacterium]|nr:hypothetical protein [Lentisphaerota bacterium]
MTEMLVGMVMVGVPVLAFLWQMSFTARNHTENYFAARRLAGELAMTTNGLPAPDPELKFVYDWHENAYGQNNADDEKDVGQIFQRQEDFRALVVDRAGRDSGDWAVIDALPDRRLSRMHDPGYRGERYPVDWFGLVAGRHSREVKIGVGEKAPEKWKHMPAVRKRLYAGEKIELKATVWMPPTRY